MPNKIPNFIHKKFNGFKKFELNKPKIKKIREIQIGIILISPLDFSGQTAIIKKTTKKTIPKPLLDGNLNVLFFI